MWNHNNVSEDGKDKKLQYGPHWYTNFPEGKKQRLVEYRKIYSRKQKN